MSYSTNGWDYIYTTNIKELNRLIASKKNELEFKNLFVENISGTYTDSSSVNHAFSIIANVNIVGSTTPTVEAFEVLNSSHYPKLHVALTVSGRFSFSGNNHDFKTLVITLEIDVDWLNSDVTPFPTPKDEVSLINVTNSTTSTQPLQTTEIEIIKKVLQKYYKENTTFDTGDSVTISNPQQSSRKFNIYKNLFAILNPFRSDKNHSWMVPKIERYCVKRNVHQVLSDETCLFSFSCMIAKDGSTVINNDIGYVDLNAIPNEASSALVIERSVFGEHMVVPQLLKIFELKEKNGEKEETKPFNIDYFDKKVTNSFRLYQGSGAANKIQENQTLSLVGQDYKGTYGVFKDSEQQYNGKVEEINVRVEENLIRVTLPNVSYDIDTETSWLLTKQKVVAYQEYEIYFGASATGKIEAKAQTKLFNLKMEHQKSLPSKILTLGGLQFIPTIYNLVKRYRSVETVNTSYIKKREIKQNQVAQRPDANTGYQLTPRESSISSNSNDNSKISMLQYLDENDLSYDINNNSAEVYLTNKKGKIKIPVDTKNEGKNEVHTQGIELQLVNIKNKVVDRHTLSKENMDFDSQLRKDIRELKSEKENYKDPLRNKLLNDFYDEFQKFRTAINSKANKILFLTYYAYKQEDREECSLSELIYMMTEADRSNLWTVDISNINTSVKEMHRYFNNFNNIKNHEKAVHCYKTYIEFLTINS